MAGALVALSAMLGGCAVGPTYHAPSAAALGVPDRFSTPVAPGGEPADAAQLARWWTMLGDPVLDRLVYAALTASPDIDAAGARLREARAALKQARAPLFPAINASGSVGRNQLLGKGDNIVLTNPIGGGGTGAAGTGTGAGTGATTSFATGGSSTTLQLGLDASYEVDLFGANRRGVEAARGDTQSALESLHDTQRSVVAEVAMDYIDARSAQERLAIAQSNLRSQDETVQIVGWRVQAGLVSGLDLAQAKAQRDQTLSTIPTLDTSFAQSANALAILIGQAPGSVTQMLEPARAVPIADRVLGTDVPAAVLARRPDVRAAERTLAAATARIGVQKAALYPALNLEGTISGNGTSVGDLTRFATGTLLASVTAPIFEGGLIRGRIDAARGSADEALANYRTAVLTALADVENALVSLADARRQEVALSAAATDSHDALSFAQSQYQAGLVDFQTVLDSERTLLSSQDGLAQARASRAIALVQLYKALGGGWQGAPMPADAIPDTPATIERIAALPPTTRP